MADKNSGIAAKPTQKEIVWSFNQKTKLKKPGRYEEEEKREDSSPVRGSISRDPRME